MRKIIKTRPLEATIQTKLTTFEAEFANTTDPDNYLDQTVKDICSKYHDNSVYPDLKEQLRKNQKIGVHTCCCYCECVCGEGDWNDLEHVKPKSKFPQEALKWDNMLLACNTCNRTDKNDNYDDLFLNVSDINYDFDGHFEYGKNRDKFILEAKSIKGRKTLDCLQDFKFNSYFRNSRYQIFETLMEKILKKKDDLKTNSQIISELEEAIEDLGKNNTFSNWLISDDANSPLYKELH